MAVCVLGAAFKPGSDDVRDSPALDVAQILQGMGAQVTVYDPVALAMRAGPVPNSDTPRPWPRPPRARRSCCCSPNGANSGSSGPNSLSSIVARRNIVDGRNVLDPVLWRDAGWNYRALGAAGTQPAMARPAARQGTRCRAAGGFSSTTLHNA